MPRRGGGEKGGRGRMAPRRRGPEGRGGRGGPPAPPRPRSGAIRGRREGRAIPDDPGMAKTLKNVHAAAPA